ncbi:hypothetical protein WN55_03390 [Dufourea novaeangliae]|uniref:Uncharacterized protein n=1 Tax=Dufourea novaeangliae TaxID=178035 RepID=A0A154PJ89_DUFNO|nr:hypothetical protein WN55_03390 [Dufourea novaeangliae]
MATGTFNYTSVERRAPPQCTKIADKPARIVPLLTQPFLYGSQNQPGEVFPGNERDRLTMGHEPETRVRACVCVGRLIRFRWKRTVKN